MSGTAAVHSEAIVIDGPLFHGDGDVAELRQANVAAANITVCDFVAETFAVVGGYA